MNVNNQGLNKENVPSRVVLQHDGSSSSLHTSCIVLCFFSISSRNREVQGWNPGGAMIFGI